MCLKIFEVLVKGEEVFQILQFHASKTSNIMEFMNQLAQVNCNP